MDLRAPESRAPRPLRVADQPPLFCVHGQTGDCAACRTAEAEEARTARPGRHVSPPGVWHDPACQAGWLPAFEGDYSQVTPCPVCRPKMWEQRRRKSLAAQERRDRARQRAKAEAEARAAAEAGRRRGHLRVIDGGAL